MKEITLIIALLFNFSVCSSFSNVNKGEASFDEDITRYSNEIFAVAGESSKIVFDDGNNCSYVPGQGIVLGMKYLSLQKKNHNKNVYEFIIRFLLAHELAHKIQYDELGNEEMSTPYCEKKKLFECQADVIAGVFMNKLYRFTSKSEYYNENLYREALSYIYDLGEEEYEILSHPSHTERRNAVRIGIEYYERETKAGAGISRSNLINWSMNLSQYITHYPHSISKYIVYKTDSRELNWNKTAENPIVRYKLEYMNISDLPIKLFIQTKITAVSRKYVSDISDIDPQGDIANHEVIIQPHSTVSIRGHLNWSGTATKKTMPHISSPPDVDCLYKAVPLDETEVVFNSNCESVSYGLMGDSFSIFQLTNELLRINESSNENFESLTQGMGTAYVDKSPKFIEFNTDINLGENSSAIISDNLDDDTRSLESGLYYGDDEKKAYEIFNIFFNVFKELSNNNAVNFEDDYDYLTQGGLRDKYWVENDVILVNDSDKNLYKKIKIFFTDCTFRQYWPLSIQIN